MERPFPAYQGDEAFTFVCYAHEDEEEVYADIGWLHERGLNLWYDEGIAGGSIWREEIGEALDSTNQILFFVSKASLASNHCNHEMNYALDQGIDVLPVYLEDVVLTTDLRVGLARVQAIKRYLIPGALYREKLLGALTGTRKAGNRSRTRNRRGSRIAPAVILGAAAVLALLLYNFGVLDAPRDNRSTLNPASLAVLTFSSDLNDQSYIAAGLSEVLRGQLRRVPGLSLMSADSSGHFDDKDTSPEIVRERLVVAHYVTGLLQRRGAEIELHAELVDTADGSVVLTRDVKVEVDEAMDFSRSLAMDIAIALLPLNPTDIALSLGNPRATKPGAYGPYLHALDLIGQPPDPSVLNAAENKLKEALAIDETFAKAHAALCETYRSMVAMTGGTDERLDSAIASCMRALELDNTLWEVRYALGRLYTLMGDYERAISELRLADALNANNTLVQLEMGVALGYLGEISAAETAFKRGVQLDPGSWAARADLGDFYFEHARYPEALAAFRRVTELRPESGYALVSLGAAHYHLDNRDEAEQAWRQAMQENPGSTSRAYWQAAHWMGFHRYYQGCYDAMAYWHYEAARFSPKNYAPWGELGEACYLQQSNPSLADDIFQHAIALARSGIARNPSDWRALSKLAFYQARVGEPDAGAANIQRIVAGAPPDSPLAIDVEVLAVAAQYATVAGDDEAADRYRQKAIESGHPILMLMRDPTLGTPQNCPARLPAESLDCAKFTMNVPGLLERK